MRLKKFVHISNVGRFKKVTAMGDVELRRYNLVFAENGRGKTTLCTILRSMQSGDSAPVIGRTTLGVNGRPEVRCLFDDGIVELSNGKWNKVVPDIMVFDAAYVSENVYSGDFVDVHHRRNLYRVIVGKTGVELAQQIERLDNQIREMNTHIRNSLALVQALAPKGIAAETFLSLPQDPNVDDEIAEKEKELEAVRQAEKIVGHPILSELALPVFPDGMNGLLRKTIDELSDDALRLIYLQIDKHKMHERGKAWLAEGLSYVQEENCPFCGQSIVGNPLIAKYRAYFGEAYDALRAEIASLRKQVDADFGEKEIARVEKVLGQNKAAHEFWSKYYNIDPLALGSIVSELPEVLRALREAAVSLLDRKASSPLDVIQADAEFEEACNALFAVQREAASCNEAIRTINSVITAKKETIGSTGINAIEGELALLRASKRRHEPDSIEACHQYENALKAKKELERRKAEAKDQLDRVAKDVIGPYEKAINRLLDDFVAGFNLANTKHGYPGGVASSIYQLVINGVSVDLGGEDAPLDRPSFRNTLSSGDKSTLALAFFLAQLECDPEKHSRIVVFDDPFNSQDSFRKDCTVKWIKKCGELCSQVVVLSHDQAFLKRIWERLANQVAERKCLKLARFGSRETVIDTWDVEHATRSQVEKDKDALVEYYNGNEGSSEDIVKKLRPVLETFCRNRCPSEFSGVTLGAIVGKIRDFGEDHPLWPHMSDLDEINTFTRSSHHGQDPDEIMEPISDEELYRYVRKCLDIIGGC